MRSQAETVEAYLNSLPEDRRAEIGAVRKVILENLDASYEEGIHYGMIGYYVPHRIYAKGYHCDPKQPLPFAALGSQKNYMSLHLMPLYACTEEGPGNENLQWFRSAWMKTGKKLDMGKACIRFKKAGDLALDVIGEAIRRVPASAYIKFCEAALERPRERVSKTQKAGTARAT